MSHAALMPPDANPQVTHAPSHADDPRFMRTERVKNRPIA